MNRKRAIPTDREKAPPREQKTLSWRYCILTGVCALFLVAGFFFAAQQHFSSIEISIKNSRLKKQLDNLEADQRRLLLAKEIALSPAEIKKAAKKIGLTAMTASNSAISSAIGSLPQKPRSEKSSAEKPKQAVIVKSEDVKTNEKKPLKPAKEAVKTPETKDKTKDKKETAATKSAK